MESPLGPGGGPRPTRDRTLASFRGVRGRRVVAMVDSELERSAREAGLFEPRGVERAFDEAPATPGRAATALVAVPGTRQRLLLRRLRHGGLLGRLRGGLFLGSRRALSELRVTARLRADGAPVPRAALAVGKRVAGPFFEWVVGTFFEEGTVDALRFLEADPEPMRVSRAAASAGAALRHFHDLGGWHADLHVKNLLLRERPDGTECILVDLDRARIASEIPPGERMAQLMRLYRSLLKRGVLDRVGRRGCARFFAAYCARDRALRRALCAHARRELRKVAIHRLAYRQRPASPAGDA